MKKRRSLILDLLKRGAKRASALEELLDAALYELKSALPEGGLPGDAGASTILKAVAKPVSSLTIRLEVMGASQVKIDDDKPFHLSRRLTLLLREAASGPPDQDGIASYRSAAEVAKQLGVTKNALNNLVLRLRKALREHGWNPFLLQTDRSQRDARLRFLTRSLLVIEKA